MPHELDMYSYWTLFIFIVGYLCIIFEHKLAINKATSALLMAVGCWALQFADLSREGWNNEHLLYHIARVSQVIIFLLGALTIVETIHAHGGLNLILRIFRVRSKVFSMCLVGLTTFILSSILDNLTTTIVMVIMLKKLLKDTEHRLIFGSIVVISANAGGAWTPIGDLTTTMLWVDGQLATIPLMVNLFLPSLACLIAALIWFSCTLKGTIDFQVAEAETTMEPRGKLIFMVGILSLMFVPIFKVITGLPPFMAILFSMSIVWLVTDLLHYKYEDRKHLRVVSIFPRIDLSGIFFFLGILLSVDALETAGILKAFAVWLDQTISSKVMIATIIGLISAVIDNVPLVEACMESAHGKHQPAADPGRWVWSGYNRPVHRHQYHQQHESQGLRAPAL